VLKIIKIFSASKILIIAHTNRRIFFQSISILIYFIIEIASFHNELI